MGLYYEFLKIMDRYVQIYNNFLLPAIICDRELEARWSNPAAQRLYPLFTETRGVRQLLSELSRDELFEKLHSEGTQIVAGALGLFDTQINLLPIAAPEGMDEPVGVIVVIVEGAAVSTHEALLKRSETPYSLEKGIRRNVEKIFESLDSISHKADLLDLNWLEPGLNSIAHNSYSVLRVAENITGYMQMFGSAENISPRYVEVFSRLRLLIPTALALANDIGISLAFEIPDSDGAMNADIDKLELAFFNILHNALNFVGKEGKVIVTAAEDRQRDTVSVTVKDDGPCIPENVLPHVTSSSPILPGPPEKSPRGLGLGLLLPKW